MVSEKINAASEAAASLMIGKSTDEIVHRYRQHVARNAKPGSIILFHDSEKSFPKLSFALPKVLDYFSKKGYEFWAIEK